MKVLDAVIAIALKKDKFLYGKMNEENVSFKDNLLYKVNRKILETRGDLLCPLCQKWFTVISFVHLLRLCCVVNNVNRKTPAFTTLVPGW